MRTDDLIDELAGHLRPVSPHAAATRLGLGVSLGGVAALGLLLVLFGLRPDLADASRSMMFWTKLLFTATFGMAAFVLVDRLGRPGGDGRGVWWMLAVPVAVVALMGLAQLTTAPAAERLSMWIGHSALQCPLRIMALAAPVYAGVLWAFRRLAPTRPGLTGFGAGVLSGCAGASIYALYCTENAAVFLATWYTLGILGSGLAGALLGTRLLRW